MPRRGTTAAGPIRCRARRGCRAPGWSARAARRRLHSSSMSAVSKLLTPQCRILPAAFSASKACDRLGERHAAAPMQQIEVDRSVPQALEAAFAGGVVAAPRRVGGSTLLTMKTSSRRPAIASPTSSSAPPLAYISAVSISVRPRSMPSRSAATSSPPARVLAHAARCPGRARARFRRKAGQRASWLGYAGSPRTGCRDICL